MSTLSLYCPVSGTNVSINYSYIVICLNTTVLEVRGGGGCGLLLDWKEGMNFTYFSAQTVYQWHV